MSRPDEEDESDGSLLREIARIDDAAKIEEAPRPSGARLGRFVLRSEIGRGGMGIVYRADDEQLGRPVALKVLRAHTRTDPHRRARFLREARSAAALVHRNVAAVYEIGEVDGELYIAMELVAGESLRQRLVARGGALPVEEAVTIARGIARALAAAHGKGIVHRDLKPENVMLDAEGEPKVLDFGLAKVNESAPPPQDILERQPTEGLSTAEGHLLGTPAYMSPEQAQGRAVDVRSDVFSFGIVLFEMLAGERPFKGDSGMSLAIAIVRDPPVDLARVKREVSRGLASLVSVCLAKAPADRYASGRELYEALEGVERGDGRASTALVATLAALVVAVLVGLVVRRHVASSSLAASLASATPSDAGPQRPRTMTEYPPPATKSAAAGVLYAAYLQNVRDASGGEDGLSQAVKLDPSFAAAYLRKISPWEWHEHRVVDIRDAFALAQQYRASLDDRERALLNAYEPFTQDPVDWTDAIARLRAVLVRFPEDMETMSALAATLSHCGNREEARALELHLLESDPQYALALAGLGDSYIGIDDERARDFYQRCLDASPRATACGARVADIESREGRCADYEKTARRLVATDPRNPYVDFILAEALAAQDAPVESVAALLDKWAALDQVDDTRSAGEHRDETEMALAMMTGDFPRVIAAARDQERLRATETSEAQHVEPAMKIISSLEEEGHPDQALRVADDFVRRSPAWTLDDADIRLYQLYARHHAGLVDAPTFRRTLAETQQAEAARLMAIDADGARFWAVVGNADANPLDLELARPYLDHPQSGSFEAVRGHVLLLAGRLDDALPALRSGAATCGCLVTPRTFIQAHLWLGEALEAKGDTAGACTNYAVVIHRWKNAKPRSITLEKAKARSRALHCPAVS